MASMQDNVNHKNYEPTEKKMNNLMKKELATNGNDNLHNQHNQFNATANQIQSVSPKASSTGNGFCLTGPVTDL